MQRAAVATIASIYDAAGNSDRWNSALDQCVDFCGASAANLLVHDQDSDTPWHFEIASKLWREAPRDDLVRAIEQFRQHDISAWHFVHGHPKQTLLCDTDFITDVDMLNRREDYIFFRETFSLGRRVGARLSDNQCWSDNLAFQFDSAMPQVPVESMAIIRSLLPHAAKAIETWRVFGQLKQRYDAILGVLDHIAIGLCVVSDDGTVLVHNQEAARIFSESPGLHLDSRQRIRCNDLNTQLMLESAIASTTIARGAKACRAECIFTVPDAVQDHPLLVEVTPLRDTDRELAEAFTGSLVSLIDPATKRQFDVTRISKGYHLTDAEAMVCQYLVEGWTNNAIAEERGVRVDTIKSQIKSIFVKTSTRRRSDLVRLCLKVDPPFC